MNASTGSPIPSGFIAHDFLGRLRGDPRCTGSFSHVQFGPGELGGIAHTGKWDLPRVLKQLQLVPEEV